MEPTPFLSFLVIALDSLVGGEVKVEIFNDLPHFEDQVGLGHDIPAFFEIFLAVVRAGLDNLLMVILFRVLQGGIFVV
jgi:hypothetical protein